jgi:MFS family permease
LRIPFPRTFQALRHHNFRLFWFGQLISLTGTWMQSIAQSWLVLDLTKSPFMLGLVSALGTLPILLFSLPAGALADRLDKRRVLIVTQSVMLLLALILAILAWTHVVKVWHIIVLASLLGISNAFDMPTRQSFVIEMVGRDDLLNAIALNSSAFNSARIIGPAFAGLLIGTVGVATCFFLNSVSFLAVIAGLALMRFEPQPSKEFSEPLLRDMLEGLRYIVRHRDILTLILLVGVFSIFGAPYLVLMPVLAKDVLLAGAKGYAVLMSATGIGALAGALTLASLPDSGRRGRLLVASAILFAAVLVVFAASRQLILSAALATLLGFSMVGQGATGNTLLQTLAPDHLRGRVMAVFAVMFVGFAPLGSLQAGFVAQHFSAPGALMLGSGVMAIAIALTLVFRPGIRAL